MKLPRVLSRAVQLNVLLICFLSALLAACGGGSGGGGWASLRTVPVIQAMVLSFPSGAAPASMPTAMVSVLDGSTGANITNATVTVNGAPLAYNSAPGHLEYEGTLSINSGASVTLVVNAGGATYTATGTQATSYPAISAPVSGATWLTGNANTVGWSGGAPLANASYLLGVVDASDPVGGPAYFQSLATSANSYTISSWSLPGTAGGRDVILGLTTLASVPNADPASYMQLGGFNYVPITVTPLPIPPNVRATAGDGQVAVSWSPTVSASSYNIYWSTKAANSNKVSGTKISGITNPSYVHTGLSNGTPYYYTVTEVSGNAESAESPVVSATPGAPTIVTASPGNTQATIGWSSVTGASSYNVYWSTTAANATKLAGTRIAGATSPYSHTGLTNGTPYYYAVTGVSAAGESSASTAVKAIPGSSLRGGGVQGYPPALSNAVTTMSGGLFMRPELFGPYGVTTDGNNLYVADGNIKKIVIATGMTTVLAGGTAGSCGATDGTGTAATFCGATDVTTDGTNLYIADSGNHTIRKIVIATGAVTTLAGTAGVVGSADGVGAAATFNYPDGITTDGTNLYVTDGMNNNVRKIVIATASVTTLATGFKSPVGITTDGTNLYVVDPGNSAIKQVAISTGTATVLASSIGSWGITTDGTNLYVVNCASNTVSKIAISTGTVTTLAGSAGLNGWVDGTGSAARFNSPRGITTDGLSLFVADTNNSAVRQIQ